MPNYPKVHFVYATQCESPETAMVVKKMELPAYDPRGVAGHALGYAYFETGAVII